MSNENILLAALRRIAGQSDPDFPADDMKGEADRNYFIYDSMRAIAQEALDSLDEPNVRFRRRMQRERDLKQYKQDIDRLHAALEQIAYETDPRHNSWAQHIAKEALKDE